MPAIWEGDHLTLKAKVIDEFFVYMIGYDIVINQNDLIPFFLVIHG
ncbi:hypothetical protein C943_04500 [Mariniradius saccharolyticus AK6]|uniref:Uncharacterized protein n=1 Tax=Mariniradius saccharolyticus AK6 TaxID=1239962 RepID=M7Y8V2_9BACT|nr:hypothetical protein C943_04500 [Mariniradius saccharolyticus AK6]